MEKNNYKAEFEEDRKEIEQDSDKLPSRSELRRKGRKPKKKSRHLMINVFLGLFTLIPVVFLVYVVNDFYTPESNPAAKDEDTNVSYEETANKKTDEKIEDPDKDIVLDEKEDDGKDVKVVQPIPTPEAEKKPEEKPKEKTVVNVNPPPEKKPVVKSEEKPTGKTHKVANGETLYRISVNYYGSDVGVEKIKRANGLSSNNIMVGQTLTIP